MAALVAGVQYGLASQGHFEENKSLIFVKLTDSALRAIEDYLKNRSKCSQSPTIQFLGNEGQFSLPNSRAAAAKFKFSLSSNADMEGPQGSFECIQHSGQNRCLETVGPLPCKMRVQANEDVYATTKSKMKEVEKLQKENCAREIELDKTGIGRRIKSRTKVATNGRRATPSNPANQGATPPSGHTPPVLGHTRPQGNNHAQKPGNPELMKRPLRERIIHLLALRPYKKPELYMTLSREGLSAKDRNSLMNTISTVAKTERDNSYHLLRHIWNDVQDDWPFYSEQDRVVLKRRKPENLTPPASSDGSSPSSVTPGSPPSAAEPVVNLAKRPGYVDGADGLPTKRPRISHYKKPSGPGSGGGGGGGPGTPTPGGGGGCPPGGYGGGFGFVTSTTSPVQPHLPSPQPARGAMPHPSPPTPPEDNTGPPESPNPYSPPSSTTIPATIPSTQTQNVLPKYMMDYTTIKDVTQRRKYKEDFNSNYKEYRVLHSMVEKVSKRFTLLDEKLKKEERGSVGWQRIKDQIMKEYEENKRNTKNQDAKRRFQYLHEKLSYIKKLVLDYDSKNS